MQIKVGEERPRPVRKLRVHRRQRRTGQRNSIHNRNSYRRGVHDRTAVRLLRLTARGFPPDFRRPTRGAEAGDQINVQGHQKIHEERRTERAALAPPRLHAGQVVRLLQKNR